MCESRKKGKANDVIRTKLPSIPETSVVGERDIGVASRTRRSRKSNANKLVQRKREVTLLDQNCQVLVKNTSVHTSAKKIFDEK